MITKKAKLEQFDELQKEHDLLQRFFWDTVKAINPDVVEKYVTADGDVFHAVLYGADRADGGYIVQESIPGTPSIKYYDDWQYAVSQMPHGTEYTLAMKILAERISIKRAHFLARVA